MNRAAIYENVYRDLAGMYTSGMFDVIENKLNELYKEILTKEDEINMNWDNVSDEQFAFMCKALKKLMLQAVMRSRRV